jgi:hypothetical protein
MVECPESPLAIFYECAILSRAQHALIRTMLCMRKAKDLLCHSLGRADPSEQSWIPYVQRGRSFGFAETVAKHFACLRGSPQDGVSRG